MRAIRGAQLLSIPADRWERIPFLKRNRLLNVAGILSEADGERARIEAKKRRTKPRRKTKPPPGAKPG
ncbi:MAG: hypothetical protein F4Z28_05060 [Gammaproteobacteria bacterium]|nr:hypothetical protein [Gammaproteobacteria bacterium]